MSIEEAATTSTKQQPENEKTSAEDTDTTFVLLQFTDSDDANYCKQFSSQLKSINIGDTRPVIQIGNRLYTGEYANNLGTYLFFEEKSKKSSEPATAQQFAYAGKTFKKLVLTRLFVEENSNADSAKAVLDCSEPVRD